MGELKHTISHTGFLDIKVCGEKRESIGMHFKSNKFWAQCYWTHNRAVALKTKQKPYHLCKH